MQLLISTLVKSISGVANVLLVLLVVWLMFAILGVSLFSGRLIYCTEALKDPNMLYQLTSQLQCEKAGGTLVAYMFNYDTVWNGIFTLLIVSSLNMWDTLMYQAIDSSGPNTGPVQGLNPIYAYFYIAFILLSAYFFLNFLIGVLFLNFKMVQK